MSLDASVDDHGFVMVEVSVHVELDAEGFYLLEVSSIWASQFNDVTRYSDVVRLAPSELGSGEPLTL